MANTRVLITEEDFTKLIKGGIVKKDGVEIALQDIGYLNIAEIVIELLNE